MNVLVINEVMADNQSFLSKDYPALPPDARRALDWVEIYNPNATPVSLNGYSLTDDADRPRRYRFPSDATIAAGEFLIVSFLSGNDRDRIDEFLATQLARARVELVAAEAAVSDPPLEREVLAVEAAREFVAEVEGFRVSPFHVDFGLSAGQETLYLFADDELVSTASIFNLPEDTTVGLSPDGGPEFGLLLNPTPGGANTAIGVQPRFPVGGEPRPRLCVDSGQRVPLDFKVVQDVQSGLPWIRLRWAIASCDSSGIDNVAENCDLRFDGGPPDQLPEVHEGEVLPPVQTATCLQLGGSLSTNEGALDDDCHTAVDISGGLRETRTLSYRAFLPALSNGVTIQWRLDVVDDLGETTWCRCYTYGAGCIPLVIHEYQPRNSSTVPFVCETCVDPERIRYPDWLEIHNYGSEPVDLRRFTLAGRNAFRNPIVGGWSFATDTRDDDLVTPGDEDYAILGPGECRLILADDDGGDFRRIYRRLVDDGSGRLVPDLSCRYYSTSFGLDPVRGGSPDEFSLVARLSSGPMVIDRAILDFRRLAASTGSDLASDLFLADQSAARFPAIDAPGAATDEERYPPDVLTPGTVTDCPTPPSCRGAGFACVNDRDCLPGPRFLGDVRIQIADSSEAWRRCPGPNEEVIIHAWVALAPDELSLLEAELDLSVDSTFVGTLQAEAVNLDPQRSGEAPPGRVVFRLEFRVPPQGPGLVSFVLRARVGAGIQWQRLDATNGGDGGSFVWRERSATDLFPARFEEALPLNESVVLPGLSPSQGISDYLELSLPRDADVESVDLSGYWLSQEKSSDVPLRRPRRWRFPEGTLLERGERLLLVFGMAPPPESGISAISVLGFRLDDCAETAYLVSPDDDGNCVVARFSWNCGDTERPDRSFGVVCDDPDTVRLLTPTPGRDNVLPTLLASVRFDDPAGNPAFNACAGGSTPTISATVLVDVGVLFRAGWQFGTDIAPFARVVLPVVEFPLAGGAAAGAPRFDRRVSEELDVPIGYVAMRIAQAIFVTGSPDRIDYSLVIEDRCGRRVDYCGAGELCFAIGTPRSPTPELRITELNRHGVVPGDAGGEGRPWVEVFNASDAEVDLSGVAISDDELDPLRATFPEGTVMAPRSALVVLTDGGAGLSGPGAPQHVVVDLDWVPTAEIRIGGGDEGSVVRVICGPDPRFPESRPPPIELYLFDTFERGACRVDAILAADALSFPNPACDDPTSLGLDEEGGSFVVLDAPSPGTFPSGSGGASFVRGDANGDGTVGLDDAIRTLQALFLGGSFHSCRDAHDADDSGDLTLSDPVWVLTHLFLGGPPPPLPFPDPGQDPTLDDLPCE